MVFRMPKAMSGSRIRPLPARLGALAFTPPQRSEVPGVLAKWPRARLRASSYGRMHVVEVNPINGSGRWD